MKKTRCTCWVNCSSSKPGSCPWMAARPTSTGLAACMARAWRAGKSSPAMLSAAGRGSFIQILARASRQRRAALAGQVTSRAPAPPGGDGAVTGAAAARPAPSGRAAPRLPCPHWRSSLRPSSSPHSRSRRPPAPCPHWRSSLRPSRGHWRDRLQLSIPGPRPPPAHWRRPYHRSARRALAARRPGPPLPRPQGPPPPQGAAASPAPGASATPAPGASAPAASAHGAKDHHDQHGEDQEPQGATTTVKDERTSSAGRHAGGPPAGPVAGAGADGPRPWPPAR